MLTKHKDKTMKRGLAAMGVLSVLLGAQMGVLAIDGSGGTGNPPEYDYGWSAAGMGASLYGNGSEGQRGYILGACGAHYGIGGSSYNECVYGGGQYIAGKNGGSNK